MQTLKTNRELIYYRKENDDLINEIHCYTLKQIETLMLSGFPRWMCWLLFLSKRDLNHFLRTDLKRSATLCTTRSFGDTGAQPDCRGRSTALTCMEHGQDYLSLLLKSFSIFLGHPCTLENWFVFQAETFSIFYKMITLQNCRLFAMQPINKKPRAEICLASLTCATRNGLYDAIACNDSDYMLIRKSLPGPCIIF